MPRLKLLHGFHAITARLRAFPATVNEVWYDPARQDARMRAFLHLAASANARLIAADASRLNALSGEKRHQGVVARVTEATRAHSLETLLDTIEGQPLLLALDGVTDPHTLGACLRVADGAGAHAVIAPRRREAGDEVVRIPLAGHVQSLNVSVASGICLFEAVRQRLKRL